MSKYLLKISVALVSIVISYILIQLYVPSDIGVEQLEVQIPEGSTFRQALEVLYDNNLIRDKNIFLLIGRLTSKDKGIKAGFYEFSGRMSPWDVYQKLLSGKIIEHDITLLEGETIFDLAVKLHDKKIISKQAFEQIAVDKAILSKFKIDAPSLEGYLYPDTYKIPKGASIETILKLMINRMRAEFDEKLRKRAEELGLSENQVLTLASIIEREATVDEERAIISAVYHNRLKHRMPLQADPTAVYGVKSYKTKIYLKDLQTKTAYNTYVIKGLPPGPISAPSKKSIIAALYPADVNYLYFVAVGNGYHKFSRTYQEHLKTIKTLRAKREVSQ